jgi:aminoglycoside 6'-N-acetyltransferase
MSIIKTHQLTLRGGLDHSIVLRPLSDDHLPYLYKWCADPEVLYWTEGGPADKELSYGPETVHRIYGTVSQDAICFLIEADGIPIGECWLQKMNLPEVRAIYPEGTDVRRIDISIGEKEYWGRGIGTTCVRILVDLAFSRENVEVLHCICEDYNVRSVRMWEKLGFSRILAKPLPAHYKGQWEYHYRLTRQEFLERRAKEVEQIPPSGRHCAHSP